MGKNNHAKYYKHKDLKDTYAELIEKDDATCSIRILPNESVVVYTKNEFARLWEPFAYVTGTTDTSKDNVNHPSHYTSNPSGIECIDVVRYMTFNIGNVVKYCWRAGLKSEEGMTDKEKRIEDLKKAQFYLNDEIKRLESN